MSTKRLDWEAIRNDYHIKQLNTSQVAKLHGCSSRHVCYIIGKPREDSLRWAKGYKLNIHVWDANPGGLKVDQRWWLGLMFALANVFDDWRFELRFIDRDLLLAWQSWTGSTHKPKLTLFGSFPGYKFLFSCKLWWLELQKYGICQNRIDRYPVGKHLIKSNAFWSGYWEGSGDWTLHNGNPVGKLQGYGKTIDKFCQWMDSKNISYTLSTKKGTGKWVYLTIEPDGALRLGQLFYRKEYRQIFSGRKYQKYCKVLSV